MKTSQSNALKIIRECCSWNYLMTLVLILWRNFQHQFLLHLFLGILFVNSGNMMNESFQKTDTLFWTNQVNIVTMNILQLDMQHR